MHVGVRMGVRVYGLVCILWYLREQGWVGKKWNLRGRGSAKFKM